MSLERELFNIWAPRESPWSAWAKPVLFATMQIRLENNEPELNLGFELEWLPSPGAATALVVDTPDDHSALLGLALAKHGYQPVPLYNTTMNHNEILPTGKLIKALVQGAMHLRKTPLPPHAPPAFLLDARRTMNSHLATPGRYDNRWLTFPQDFPSAGFLQTQGIHSVILLQTGRREPQDDLAHVLLRWQEGRISIQGKDLLFPGPPRPLRVDRPSHFRQMWYRALMMIGARRNSAGGFGSFVPQPSQSSGGRVGGFG